MPRLCVEEVCRKCWQKFLQSDPDQTRCVKCTPRKHVRKPPPAYLVKSQQEQRA